VHFFLFDFALAFIALLGYRAVAAVRRDRVAMLSLEGRRAPRPALEPESRRARKHAEPEPVLPQRLLRDHQGCGGVGDSVTCCERPPHRLINLW
jgi:hypothetical protein